MWLYDGYPSSCNNIPTNLPNTKSRTKSPKKRDFWSKSGTFLYTNLTKIAEIIKSNDKLVPKKALKKRDTVMKKWGSGKFWTKKQDSWRVCNNYYYEFPIVLCVPLSIVIAKLSPIEKNRDIAY